MRSSHDIFWILDYTWALMAVTKRNDVQKPSSAGGAIDLGTSRYYAAAIAAIAQAATLAITWPLWQVRRSPPHLPMVNLPQIPFDILLAVSLAVVFVRPRVGVRLYVALLAVSFVFDQWRVQPQVIGIAVLMVAAVESWGPAVGRSYLIAMWFWSGLHKLLSPDWFGQASWDLLQSLPIEPHTWHRPFAVSLGVGEIALSILAIARPRWAAAGCVLLHLSIAAFLSPWVHDWNVSVIPWNVCTALVGSWILWRAPAFRNQSRFELAAAALLLVAPAGFYSGWVDHSLAHVLYSENVPYGVVTTSDGTRRVPRFASFRVPFPHTRRTIRQYFAATAPSGSKLQIVDPRPGLSNAYFVKNADASIVEIDLMSFASSSDGIVAGVEADDPRAVFALSLAGVRMLKRTQNSMIYALEISPKGYRPELLRLLSRLPNLEQLQLAGCKVTDDDLHLLIGCDNLREIGLNNTELTDAGVRILSRLPRLDYMELEGTNTSARTSR